MFSTTDNLYIVSFSFAYDWEVLETILTMTSFVYAATKKVWEQIEPG